MTNWNKSQSSSRRGAMRKNKLIKILIGFMMVFFILNTQAISSNKTVTAQDVKSKTKEMLNTIQQYSVKQRDKAVEKAGEAIDNIDARLDALENRVDNNWDKMSQTAREKSRANLRALRQQRNELSEWYGGFKNSSADAWEQMKMGFSDAYKSLSDSWEKAKSEYDAEEK
jgi:hypothetical protein